MRKVDWRVGARLLIALPWVLLLLAVLVIGYPLLKEAPLSHDHPTHLFKSWHMATQLLPSFRVRGFSHYWVFGFPSDELVPPSELWVVLFRALTLGKLTWLRTYGVAMFALLLLWAVATFCFTRRYFGSLAGVIAGVLMVWDPGGWAQGGWYWCIEFGVWPITLGVACIFLSLVSLEKLLEKPSARQFAFTGVWVAASFIAHQVTILFLPVMVALMLADHWLRRASTPQRMAIALLACAFGVSLAGFYLVPMLARSGQTLDLGVAGNSPTDVANRLLELKIFDGTFPAFVVLGFVGAMVALRRRAPGAFFLAAGTALFLLLSTDIVIHTFHAERLMPNLRKIEAQRMLYGAKILWFPLVAYALALPFEGLPGFVRSFRARPLRTLRASSPRYWIGVAACCALLAPYAVPAYHKFKSTQVDKKVPGEEVDFWKDLKLVWAHTATLRAQSTEVYRIAYDLPMHDHLSTISPVFDNTFMYKVGYTPTQLFVGFPMYEDLRLYRELCVKYVVSDHPLDAQAYALEKRFGKLSLYRFKDFDGKPFSFTGPGIGELLEFSPERVRLRVSGATSETKLKLHVSYMDHWRARANGESIRIVPATVFDVQDPILMEVPAKNGEVVFEYVNRASDWLGLILTLSAVPAFAFALYVRRRHAEWLRLPRISLRVRRVAWALGSVAVLAAIAGLVVRFRSRTALVSKTSLFRGLEAGEMKVDGKPCTSEGPFQWSCDKGQIVKAERVSGLYGTHICLNTGGKLLELTTKRPVGEFLLGEYDVRAGSGSLQAWLNDRDLGSVTARPTNQGLQFLQFDTRAERGQPGTFRLELRGSPLHCFDFYVSL